MTKRAARAHLIAALLSTNEVARPDPAPAFFALLASCPKGLVRPCMGGGQPHTMSRHTKQGRSTRRAGRTRAEGAMAGRLGGRRVAQWRAWRAQRASSSDLPWLFE